MENTLYDDALEEYNAGDENNKHKLIYAYVGLAIYWSQCIEESFAIMLWTSRIFKQKVRSNDEVNKIIDEIENSKKTMGGLLKEVKESYTLTESIINSLEIILNQRNYLAHKFFKLEIEKFCSETGKKEMLKYLCDFICDAKMIDSELKEYYTKNTMKLGFTEEKIALLIEEMREAEVKRDYK